MANFRKYTELIIIRVMSRIIIHKLRMLWKASELEAWSRMIVRKLSNRGKAYIIDRFQALYVTCCRWQIVHRAGKARWGLLK